MGVDYEVNSKQNHSHAAVKIFNERRACKQGHNKEDKKSSTENEYDAIWRGKIALSAGGVNSAGNYDCWVWFNLPKVYIAAKSTIELPDYLPVTEQIKLTR